MAKKEKIGTPHIIIEVESGCVVSARSSIEGMRYQVDDRDAREMGPILLAGGAGHKASRARLIELLQDTIPNMICESLQEEINVVLRQEGL
jgi:hypothetical protein